MDIKKLMDELKLYGCIQQGREASAEKVLARYLASPQPVAEPVPVVEEPNPAPRDFDLPVTDITFDEPKEKL